MSAATSGAGRRDGRQRHSTSAELYEPLGWMLVRAPMLPVESYREMPAATDPLVRTALAVASPDLAEQLERADGTARSARGAAKLLRYLIRMSTRPTPFGLFAGVGLARFGPTTDLRISAGVPRTRMRPDMAWMLGFVARLEQRPEVRHELQVTTNPSALVADGRVLLAERVQLDSGADGGPVGIRATGAVRRALVLGRTPIGWRTLATELLATPGATEEKVEELLNQLWQQTFLLTELRPPLTHPAPARYVEQRLARIPAAHDEHAVLAQLLDDMAHWDDLGLAERPAALRALTSKASAALPSAEGVPVQVDTALAMDGARVAAPIGRTVARAAEILLRLGSAAGGDLRAYGQSFLNRYGADREVALLELLDPVRGLGPPAPAFSESDLDARRATLRQATLRQLAVDALRDKRLTVQLDEATLSRLEHIRPTADTAPVSMDLSVVVLASSPDAIDAGNFSVVVAPNLGAQAAGRNLGRFADLLGQPATEALKEVAAAERAASPVDLHAEALYLPRSGRSANVAIRPSCYDHEVVAGTLSTVDPQCAIPLSELLVGVRGGRFYVRWPAAPGDLHVHTGHMLTSMAAPAAIRFLEDITRGDRLPLVAFQWGPVGDLPFLPRIEIDQIVLSPAQWQVDNLRRDTNLAPDDPGFPALLASWREAWLVPSQVYLTRADNRLLLDLDIPEHAEQLREELRRVRDGHLLILQEPLPATEHAWLQGPDGHHLAELVVPLVQRGSRPAAPPVAPHRLSSSAPTRADRVRSPGSDWLYAKLYGPADGHDELLADAVRRFGEFATGSGLAQLWFFLRYADPEPHLRVRFGGDPGQLLSGLLPALCKWAQDLIDDGFCSKLSLDTYEREIERYGGLAAMPSAEQIFSVDSATVVELLHLVRSQDVTLDRALLAVLSVDALLDELGLDVDGRLAFCRDVVVARHETGADYRVRQRELRRLLGLRDAGDDGSGAPQLARVLQSRRSALAPLAGQLQALEHGGQLTKPLSAIVGSLVHMHCNRLLGAEPPSEQHVLGLLLRTREGLQRAPHR